MRGAAVARLTVRRGQGSTGQPAVVRRKPPPKKEPEGDFVCLPLAWPTCLAVVIGSVVAIGGAAVCAAGFHAETLSTSYTYNGTQKLASVNQAKLTALKRLTFVGPVIMGTGSFIIVVALVVMLEMRDKLIQRIKLQRLNDEPRKPDIYDTILMNMKTTKSPEAPSDRDSDRGSKKFGIFNFRSFSQRSSRSCIEDALRTIPNGIFSIDMERQRCHTLQPVRNKRRSSLEVMLAPASHNLTVPSSQPRSPSSPCLMAGCDFWLPDFTPAQEDVKRSPRPTMVPPPKMPTLYVEDQVVDGEGEGTRKDSSAVSLPTLPAKVPQSDSKYSMSTSTTTLPTLSALTSPATEELPHPLEEPLLDGPPEPLIPSTEHSPVTAAVRPSVLPLPPTVLPPILVPPDEPPAITDSDLVQPRTSIGSLEAVQPTLLEAKDSDCPPDSSDDEHDSSEGSRRFPLNILTDSGGIRYSNGLHCETTTKDDARAYDSPEHIPAPRGSDSSSGGDGTYTCVATVHTNSRTPPSSTHSPPSTKTSPHPVGRRRARSADDGAESEAGNTLLGSEELETEPTAIWIYTCNRLHCATGLVWGLIIVRYVSTSNGFDSRTVKYDQDIKGAYVGAD